MVALSPALIVALSASSIFCHSVWSGTEDLSSVNMRAHCLGLCAWMRIFYDSDVFYNTVRHSISNSNYLPRNFFDITQLGLIDLKRGDL